MNKIILTCIVSLSLIGCHSTANFKRANVIKPHLDAAFMESEAFDESSNKETALVNQGLEHYVYFEFNSDELTVISKAMLQQHVDAMNSIKIGKVVLQGHTDHVGSEPANHNLAKRRALSVWRYLVSLGVDGESMVAVSMGEGDFNHIDAEPAKNRHVQLIY